MTIGQAIQIVAMWQAGFDTYDISAAVGIHEAEVCKVLDAVRSWERGDHVAVGNA